MTSSLRSTGWLALAALAVLTAWPASAQHDARTCGTPTPTTEEVLASVAQVERWLAANPGAANRGGTMVTIPVAMHIVMSGTTPAQGNAPDQWIIDQMDVLNEAYESMGFQFVIAFQQRVVNADWANLTYGGADETAMKQALHLDPARYLNMYFVPNITSPQGSLLGFATFPAAGAETDFRQGAVNITGSMPGGNEAPYNQGDTATHEVGHYVGLYHTFQGGCSASPSGGDGVPDTPAEASAAFGCPTGRDSCPSLPGVDPITNFMDYVDDVCMVEFTEGQRTRALALMTQYRPTIMTQAGGFLSLQAMSFGELYVGESVTRTVSVLNIGTEPFTFTASANSPAFSVSPASATVPGGGSVEIEVTFAPIGAGAATGTLSVVTSDAEIGTLTASLSGTGVLAASATFSSLGFWADAPVGGSATATLTLGNGGPGVLSYAIGAGARMGATAPAPEAPVEVKGAPGLPGDASPLRGAGGPDAFGYSWIDSNEPGGPAFAWVDIATTGNAVSLLDDGSATVPLPFAFSFYGTDQNNVRIVSNGFLAFGGSSNAYSNAAIPTAAVPNNVIAPFWDDLDPTSGGQVRYRNMGDGRFVVSWLGVPHFGGSGTYTFQAILYADGRIRYQYHTMTGMTDNATVGIENATGTDGLQVVYNSSYVANNLAVEFRTQPQWLSAAPSSGTVAVGGSEQITLTMDASELEAGVYQEMLTLTHNDPAQPMPARAHVVFAVGDAFAPPALAAPAYGSEAVSRPAALAWMAADGATGYEWQVSTSATFATTAASGSGAPTSALATGLDENTTYYWRVRSTGTGSPSEWSLAGLFTTGTTVSTAPAADASPLALGAVFPNPVRGVLTVPFSLAEADASVSVRVLDVTGRVVATLAERQVYAAGPHRIEWDTTRLPAGVYVVEMQAGGLVQTGRVTVMR